MHFEEKWGEEWKSVANVTNSCLLRSFYLLLLWQIADESSMNMSN